MGIEGTSVIILNGSAFTAYTDSNGYFELSSTTGPAGLRELPGHSTRNPHSEWIVGYPDIGPKDNLGNVVRPSVQKGQS